MVITEIELRELWRDGRGALPPFPAGARFSPSAQDFLKDHGLTVQFAAPPEARNTTAPATRPLPADLPARLDRLHALALLTAAEARSNRLLALAERLDALADECGKLPAAAPGQSAPAASAVPFAVPGPHDHLILHWLNLLRATAREVEAAALAGGASGLAAQLHAVEQRAVRLAEDFRSGALAWTAA